MQPKIYISSISSISALGKSSEDVWNSYVKGKSFFQKKEFSEKECFVVPLTDASEKIVEDFLQKNPDYERLDRSVVLALIAAENAFKNINFFSLNIGINIGSSRGATALFEKYHEQFLNQENLSPLASPTTTLGNISSWVGQHLAIDGPTIGHSVTCSTALHAMLNGIAWLKADMTDAFVVGGSEAALTPFTIAQMKALKIYSNETVEFPCRSMDFKKEKNTMVLGEGAAVAVLSKELSKQTEAEILGYGFASEKIEHSGSISEHADCFQKSMKMALDSAEIKSVDVAVLHAPGTKKGDLAEYNAINKVFSEKLPLLTSNKWLVGHTFAASGMLSVEMAVMMLKNNRFIENPFFKIDLEIPKKLQTIMINAVGFGGNAVSIIIGKPKMDE